MSEFMSAQFRFNRPYKGSNQRRREAELLRMTDVPPTMPEIVATNKAELSSKGDSRVLSHKEAIKSLLQVIRPSR